MSFEVVVVGCRLPRFTSSSSPSAAARLLTDLERERGGRLDWDVAAATVVVPDAACKVQQLLQTDKLWNKKYVKIYRNYRCLSDKIKGEGNKHKVF